MAKRDDRGRFVKATERISLPKKVGAVRPTAAKVVASHDEPREAGWWQRWWRGEQGRPAKRVDVTDLRERVMGELQARSARDEANAPFSRPLLPEREMPRRGGDWLFTGFVVACLAAIVLMLVVGGRQADGPGLALKGMMDAIANKDSAAFAQVVDVDAVSTDLVEQVFGTPVLDAKVLPQRLKAQLAGQPKDITAMVKPGLAATLADDMLRAVEKGQVDPATLLGRLWQDMGGRKLEVGMPRLVRSNDGDATAEMVLGRTDSDQVIEVVGLRLAKVGGAWRVVGLPSVAPVLARLQNVTTQVADAEAVMAAVEPSVEPAVGDVKGLRVGKVGKSLEPVGDVMTVRVTLANDGAQDISRSVVWVTFADARGIPLRIVELEDGQMLAAGAKRERVLPVPVDRSDKRQRWVAELPLSALTVQTRVVAAR